MSIKFWIFIAYLNLMSLWLNVGAMAYEGILIFPCLLAILVNGMAIFVCLAAIQRKTEK